VLDQPEVLLMNMASWLPQEMMDAEDDSSDDDDVQQDNAAAAGQQQGDEQEQMTLLQLAHVSSCYVHGARAYIYICTRTKASSLSTVVACSEWCSAATAVCALLLLVVSTFCTSYCHVSSEVCKFLLLTAPTAAAFCLDCRPVPMTR
jgi:hypothetical protein